MRLALLGRMRRTARIRLAILANTAIHAVLVLAGGYQKAPRASGQEPVRPSAQAPHVAPGRLFRSPKGNLYAFRIEPEIEDSDAAELAERRSQGGLKPGDPALGPDDYKGTDRKAAKLSMRPRRSRSSRTSMTSSQRFHRRET